MTSLDQQLQGILKYDLVDIAYANIEKKNTDVSKENVNIANVNRETVDNSEISYKRDGERKWYEMLRVMKKTKSLCLVLNGYAPICNNCHNL